MNYVTMSVAFVQVVVKTEYISPLQDTLQVTLRYASLQMRLT